MSKKTNIYEYLQTEAISGTLNKSDLAFFRKVCRWYSKTFHTPLHIVMECKQVQWDEVLLSYYEENMNDLPYNQVFDIACQEYIPELAQEFDKENEEYAEALVEEQQRTLERKKKKQQTPKPPETKGEKDVDSAEKTPEAPKPPEMKMSFDDEEV